MELFVAGIALYGDELENRKIVSNEGFLSLDSDFGFYKHRRR